MLPTPDNLCIDLSTDPMTLSTVTEEGDHAEFVIIPEDEHLKLVRQRNELRRVAHMVLDKDKSGWAEGSVGDAVRAMVEERTPELVHLMRVWQRHIRLEWPEGVKLVIEDPENFEGDARPYIRLSPELQEALADG